MYEMDLTLDIHSDLCPMAVSAEQPPEQLSLVLRPWQLRHQAVYGSGSEPCPCSCSRVCMRIAGG